MKNVIVLLFAFVLITSCGGQKKQANEDVQNVQLKGEEVPIDTALFRYAYRIRVQGDKAVVFDLHNVDYYYHVFTYPSFKYISSFGKRGEGPEKWFRVVGEGIIQHGCWMAQKIVCLDMAALHRDKNRNWRKTFRWTRHLCVL